jgi:cytoskeletal protein CcmA (bactofilin family)
VNGNISSDNHVNVIGEVTGNIRANKIDTRDSYIVGNIECMENTNIHENTVIFGNLNANNLVIDGAIQGKIDVKGDIIVGDKAIVDSDIKAKTIQVSNGAAINGHCSLCYADLNVAEFFPKDVEAAPEKAQELQEEKSQESKPKEQEHHSTGSKKKTK